jgi:hypothetical protein
MLVARTDLEIKLLGALRLIAAYDSPERMRRDAAKDGFMSFEEVIEMAYDNMQAQAKNAIRGVRVAAHMGVQK